MQILPVMQPAATGLLTYAAAARSGSTVRAVKNHRAVRLHRAGLIVAVALALASCGSTVQLHGRAGSAGLDGAQAAGDGTGMSAVGGGKQVTPLGSPDASGGGAGSSTTSGDTTG